MNLFKKIWNRNFKKGNSEKDLDKLKDDIGGLQGVFSYTPIINGEKKETVSFPNTITHLSKSNMIRLLAQGATSPYKGVLSNPSAFKISRMRFGNRMYGSGVSFPTVEEKELSYYDPQELSSRPNETDTALLLPNMYKAAGGRWPSFLSAKTPNGSILADSGSSPNTITVLASGGAFAGTSFTINIPDSSTVISSPNKRAPSHRTLSVKLYSSTNDLLTEVVFNSQYFRGSGGNNCTSVIPAQSAGAGWIIGDLFASNVLSDNKISYNSSLNQWSVTITFPSGFSPALKALLFKATASYEIGKYNIIKSIVPLSGSNAGSFSSTALNYYPITNSATKLNDSSSISAIDDFSATFTTTMNTSEGNGETDVTLPTESLYPVIYTEAFLFNDLDDLFSVIALELPSPYNPGIPGGQVGFIKDSASAFLISWSIKAIL